MDLVTLAEWCVCLVQRHLGIPGRQMELAIRHLQVAQLRDAEKGFAGHSKADAVGDSFGVLENIDKDLRWQPEHIRRVERTLRD